LDVIVLLEVKRIMEEHDFKLQASELKRLIENGEISINSIDEDKKLNLELTEDVEIEKSESYEITKGL